MVASRSRLRRAPHGSCRRRTATAGSGHGHIDFAGCRIWNRPAAPAKSGTGVRANRARAFRRRSAPLARQDRAQLDAGNPCTKRSIGRGQRWRCRASSAVQDNISFTKLIPLYYYLPFIQQFHNNGLVRVINKFIFLISIVINTR
jgi:hypothetical protein